MPHSRKFTSLREATVRDLGYVYRCGTTWELGNMITLLPFIPAASAYAPLLITRRAPSFPRLVFSALRIYALSQRTLLAGLVLTLGLVPVATNAVRFSRPQSVFVPDLDLATPSTATTRVLHNSLMADAKFYPK